MQVSKILFSGVDAKVSNKEIKTDVTKNSNSNLDEKKSNTAKYMIGATALAAAIAVGIIGHKNNWWRKAADAAEDLSKKGAEILENAEKNTPNVSSASLKATDLVNDIDYSDFSKIESEIYEIQGFKYKDLKNAEGKKIKTFVSDDGNRVVSTLEFDPETEKPIKMTAYQENKNIGIVQEYDPQTGIVTKEYSYLDDGIGLDFIIEHDKSTGNMIKQTFFQDDGKTLEEVLEYDPLKETLIKQTTYADDGKTIASVIDYDKESGKTLKRTIFRADGKSLWTISDYDPSTEKIIKTISYQDDGKTIKRVSNYDKSTGNAVNSFIYGEDGKTVRCELSFDKETDKLSKRTYYQPDGKTIEKTQEFGTWTNDNTGSSTNKLKVTIYNSDGKTVNSVAEYNVKCSLEADSATGEKKINLSYYNQDGTLNRSEEELIF